MYYECECARPQWMTPSSTTGSSSELSSIDFVPTLQSSSRVSSALTESSTTSTTSKTSTSTATTSETTESTPIAAKLVAKFSSPINNPGSKEDYELDVEYEEDDIVSSNEPEHSDDDDYLKFEENSTSRRRRKRESIIQDSSMWGKLTPGACLKGCAIGFWSFSIMSMVINCLGCSARIGNLLINYRCVSKQDKSVTQGLILMLISLFALIPGPILYGRIIDSTCLVWTEQCSGSRGNCQLYDQRKFRYYVNLTALALTTVGVFFDILVWKYGRNLDLYGEREEEMLKRQKRKNWSEKTTTK